MTDHSQPHPAPILGTAVRRFFEQGEYHGPERTFDERYTSFVQRALPLGEPGHAIISFMESSVKEYEPILRAISDMGLLVECIRLEMAPDWQSIADRAREQLTIADRRYQPSHTVDFAPINLLALLNELVALLRQREAAI